MRAALEREPDAPYLPRPIAFLKPLSLFVWEAPAGTPISALLGTGRAAEAACRVASALAALRRATVELDSIRSLDSELAALRHRVERLGGVRPDLLPRARALLADAEDRSRDSRVGPAPVLRAVRPQDVLCAGERVGLAKVKGIALSHPFLDAGDFLARLVLAGLTRGRADEVAEIADRFRRAYAAAGAGGDAGKAGEEDGLAGFEAGALLRLACTQAERDPRGAVARALLDEAEARLAGR